ncbi:MAG: hypothetical protein OEM99_16430, partial [Gammaproteobacteria bacterium]|nr:hypothetical protein [Gammaproteobacteria bacterium]
MEMNKNAAFLLILLSANTAFASCIEGDCENGHGHMTYADGSNYLGEWKNGKRHGQGVLTRANGGVVTGEWVRDEPKGHGTYT